MKKGVVDDFNTILLKMSNC